MDENIFTPIRDPYRLHGVVFDLVSLAGNVLVVGPLLLDRDRLSDQNIGVLLLAAVAAQFIGALIKRKPLGARLSRAGSEDEGGAPEGFMKVLLFFHFLIFTVITLMGLGLVGVVELSENGGFWEEDIWIVVSLLAGFLTVVAVNRAGTPLPSDQGSKPSLTILEFGADMVLSFSVIIITRFMWDDFLVEFTNMQGVGFNGRSIVFLTGLSILFAVFYLPSRYLFFVEDYNYPSTWLRLWLPMLPIVWQVLVG